MKPRGAAFHGALRIGTRTRRVLYTADLGLMMPTEKNEELAR
jgi:hypothetical protein